MNTKTKNRLAGLLLLAILTTIILLEWKTGLAVTAIACTFLISYRIVHRHHKTANPAADTGELIGELLIYDGIPDTIDWD